MEEERSMKNKIRKLIRKIIMTYFKDCCFDMHKRHGFASEDGCRGAYGGGVHTYFLDDCCINCMHQNGHYLLPVKERTIGI